MSKDVKIRLTGMKKKHGTRGWIFIKKLLKVWKSRTNIYTENLWNQILSKISLINFLIIYLHSHWLKILGCKLKLHLLTAKITSITFCTLISAILKEIFGFVYYLSHFFPSFQKTHSVDHESSLCEGSCLANLMCANRRFSKWIGAIAPFYSL